MHPLDQNIIPSKLDHVVDQFYHCIIIRLLQVKQGKDERKLPPANTWTTSMGISTVMTSRCRKTWRHGATVQNTGTAASVTPPKPKGSSEQGLSPSILARRKVHSHMFYFRFCQLEIRCCSPSTPLPKLQSSSQWQMLKQVLEQAANTAILSKMRPGHLCMKHDC